jgi:hypothetical protein
MRRFGLALLLVSLSIAPGVSRAQSLAGDWKFIMGLGIPMIIHVHGKPGAYTATAQTPLAQRILPASLTQQGAKVVIKITMKNTVTIIGRLQGKKINGTYAVPGVGPQSVTITRVAPLPHRRGAGLVGDWIAEWAPGLPMVFHIDGVPGKYTATFDSPNQDDLNLPATIEVNGDNVTISVTAKTKRTVINRHDPQRGAVTGTMEETIGGERFTGKVSGDTISGTLTANGRSQQITLKR